jgi:hypothetical protein
VFALTSTKIKTATRLFSMIITSTTKDFFNNISKIQAPIISQAFGELLGLTKTIVTNIHGTESQQSIPESGNRNNFLQHKEPQGYMRDDYSYVRCVQNIKQICLGGEERHSKICNTETYFMESVLHLNLKK